MGPSVECFLLYRHLKGSENTAPPQKKHDFGKGGGEQGRVAQNHKKFRSNGYDQKL